MVMRPAQTRIRTGTEVTGKDKTPYTAGCSIWSLPRCEGKGEGFVDNDDGPSPRNETHGEAFLLELFGQWRMGHRRAVSMWMMMNAEISKMRYAIMSGNLIILILVILWPILS